jgi:hypothetical protein
LQLTESDRNKIVIIDLEETEKAKVGENSELESTEASGVLSVNNVSELNRIWNVKVHLAETRERTNIQEDVLSAGEIDAGGKWTHDYNIEIKKPILTLTEIYDTCSAVETELPHWAYAFEKENPVKVTINLRNETDGQLDKIVLNKTIPPELRNISVESTTSGVAEYDEGTKMLVWKDLLVYPREESTLVFTAIATAEDSESKNAGGIVIKYHGGDQQRSKLDPDMSALTEIMTGIETAETEPNQWECTFECSNETDLMIRLDRAEIYLAPEDGSEVQRMVDENPAVEMESGKTWAASFEVASKSPPKCSQELSYTPMRVVKKRVLGKIDKIPQTIPVYRVEYDKIFDPPSVDSFDKTPVEVTIEVKNAGTARLNDIEIVDNLPDDMMPPKKEHVTIWVRGEEYHGEFEFIRDPDNDDPESPHKLTVKIHSLKDSVGELQPGESLKVNFAVMAWKSRPEKEYPSPIRIRGNTYPEGIAAEIASPEDGHKLGIIYKKRRISVKKAINKGSGAGEYIVPITVENKGEVTSENVTVTDWIPQGFEYVSASPEELEPRLEPVSDGTNLIWKFARMNPGDKMRINVTVQGDGEYERREPLVTSD